MQDCAASSVNQGPEFKAAYNAFKTAASIPRRPPCWRASQWDWASRTAAPIGMQLSRPAQRCVQSEGEEGGTPGGGFLPRKGHVGRRAAGSAGRGALVHLSLNPAGLSEQLRALVQAPQPWARLGREPCSPLSALARSRFSPMGILCDRLLGLARKPWWTPGKRPVRFVTRLCGDSLQDNPTKKARTEQEEPGTPPSSPLSQEQLVRIQKNKAAALLRLAARNVPVGFGESWRKQLSGEFGKPYFIKVNPESCPPPRRPRLRLQGVSLPQPHVFPPALSFSPQSG